MRSEALSNWYSLMFPKSFCITSHGSQQRLPNNVPLHARPYVQPWGYSANLTAVSLIYNTQWNFRVMSVNYVVKLQYLVMKSEATDSVLIWALTSSVVENDFAISAASLEKQKHNWTVFLPGPKGGPVGKTLQKRCLCCQTKLMP